MPVYCNGRECDPTPESMVTFMVNKTGAASVRGSVVEVSSTTDNAFQLAPTSSDEPIGAVLDDGVPDGSFCRVVTGGTAQVLVEDGVAPTRGYWVSVSDTVAGRAQMTAAPVPATHWNEVGHCLESKVSGTDVLAWCMLHFN